MNLVCSEAPPAIERFDPSGVSPDSCLGRLFARLDRLEAGEAIELTTVSSFSSMARLLDRARPGQFDWHLLDQGPAGTRAEIRRLPEKLRLAPGGVLAQDHLWLDQVLGVLAAAVEAGQWWGARARWRSCELWMERHARMERPVLERLHASGRLPAWVVDRARADYRHLARMGAQLSDAIERSDRLAARASLGDFRETLGMHGELEARFLYPGLGARDPAALAWQMHSA